MVVHIATLAAALIPFGNYLWTDLMPGANIVNVVLMLVLGYFVIILPLRIAGEGYSEEYYANEV